MHLVAQPLMTGNAVILKTFERSPCTQLALGQIFTKAGLPTDVLSIVYVRLWNAPHVVKQSIASPAVSKVNFTGSITVGSAIGQTCGKHVAPVVVGLRGKAPEVARQAANLAFTSKAATFGAWFHSGQVCMATQPLVVHKLVKDKLLTLMNAHIKTIKASNNLTERMKLCRLFMLKAA